MNSIFTNFDLSTPPIGHDPTLESMLNSCKTQEERDETMQLYGIFSIIAYFGSIILGCALCAIIEFLFGK